MRECGCTEHIVKDKLFINNMKHSWCNRSIVLRIDIWRAGIGIMFNISHKAHMLWYAYDLSDIVEPNSIRQAKAAEVLLWRVYVPNIADDITSIQFCFPFLETLWQYINTRWIWGTPFSKIMSAEKIKYAEPMFGISVQFRVYCLDMCCSEWSIL